MGKPLPPTHRAETWFFHAASAVFVLLFKSAGEQTLTKKVSAAVQIPAVWTVYFQGTEVKTNHPYSIFLVTPLVPGSSCSGVSALPKHNLLIIQCRHKSPFNSETGSCKVDIYL